MLETVLGILNDHDHGVDDDDNDDDNDDMMMMMNDDVWHL